METSIDPATTRVEDLIAPTFDHVSGAARDVSAARLDYEASRKRSNLASAVLLSYSLACQSLGVDL